MDSEKIVNKSKALLDGFLKKADQIAKDNVPPALLDEKPQTSNDSPLQSLWESFEKRITDLTSSIPSFDQEESFADFQSIKNRFQGYWEGFTDSFDTSGRYIEAFQTILTLVGRYQFFKLQASSLSEVERLERAEALHRQGAEELAALCKKLGGAWVKAAQFLSCHSGELPPIYSEILSELQDQAQPVEWEKVKTVLQEEFGDNWEQPFQTIDSIPLATASIGQVHKAQLRYGQTIALKIQLPGVQAIIQKDLKFFEVIAKLFNNQVEILDLEQVVRELSKSIEKELDYYNEAHNLTRFFSCYEHQQWEYPILNKELLTSRTLGMNFIDGMPIRQFLEETPSTAPAVLKELVHSFLKQIFRTGLFHADPHPGNFFVTPQGKIALLDFGAVGELSTKEVVAYRNVLTALLMEQTETIDQLMDEAGFETPYPEKLKTLLAQKRPEGYNELTKLQYYMEVMRQAEIKIPDNFVLMARVLIVIGGLLRQYKVKLDMTELAISLMT